MMTPCYAVIMSVRNEAEHIHHTIDFMRRQTILLDLWVIVDDDSTDQTRRIIDEAAARDPWITVVHRKDGGYRQAGGGAIEVLYDGDISWFIKPPGTIWSSWTGISALIPAILNDAFRNLTGILNFPATYAVLIQGNNFTRLG